MHAFMIILPILLPLFVGAALPFLKDVSSRLRNAVIFGAALLNTALVWLLILFRPTEMLTLDEETNRFFAAWVTEPVRLTSSRYCSC